jgi:hypothetical protein
MVRFKLPMLGVQFTAFRTKCANPPDIIPTKVTDLLAAPTDGRAYVIVHTLLGTLGSERR